MKHILFTLVILCQSLFLSAYTVSDNTKISILTCSSGDELYSIFGHTAIRVQDSTQNLDVVFNYGTFDFNTPNFYLKYVKGLLPYQLTVTNFNSFIASYMHDKRSVFSQTLNLSREETQKFLSLLEENYKPENRTYLYNFLYDNCTTRVRDLISKSVSDSISWSIPEEKKRFWNLLDEYLYYAPWCKWGIHTILGQKGNKYATEYEKMFLPDYLMTGLREAVYTNSEDKDLAGKTRVIYKSDSLKERLPWILRPLSVFMFLSLLLMAAIRFTKFKWLLTMTSFIMFLITSLIGVVIVFLGFFTEHPITAPNWNLIWANPLNLFILPFVFKKATPKWMQWYLVLYAFIAVISIPVWFVLMPATDPATIWIILFMIYISVELYFKKIK